jgi:hypothetical protein
MRNKWHMFAVPILRVRCYKWQNCEATMIGVLSLQFSLSLCYSWRIVHFVWAVHAVNCQKEEINNTCYHMSCMCWLTKLTKKNSCVSPKNPHLPMVRTSLLIHEYIVILAGMYWLLVNPVLLYCLQNKIHIFCVSASIMTCLTYTVIFYDRNIVSTVNLDCKLDLKAIALQARNAEYNPKVQWLPQSSGFALYSQWLLSIT